MTMKYVVLGLLHYKDLHGYRICEHIEQHFGNLWSINPGQIYPVLRNLEEDGLIDMVGVVQNEEKGPYRKLYRITESGKAEFQRWLMQSPEKGMVLRDPFLTRFVFLSYGSKERALALIDEQIAVYQKQWDLRQTRKGRWSSQNIYTRLISELGTNSNAMYLDWLKYARSQIADNLEE
jgi:DNA-binding PadR family transcriptional regulator